MFRSSIIGLFLMFSLCVFSQNAEQQIRDFGSVEFQLTSGKYLNKALAFDGVYVDHGTDSQMIDMVCTPQAFRLLEASGIPFNIKVKNKIEPKMLTAKQWRSMSLVKSSDCWPSIDYYPTYEAYEEMMVSFVEAYPELTELIDAGTLQSGRKIWVLKIGNNDGNALKSNFMYTSSMHGDEIVGYILMLQLIDHLLCNYGTSDKITQLVDGMNIYINPLANPDGAYRSGNATVAGASRFNSNFVDLNRNFPDPKTGQNPDNRSTQQETQIFMDFAEAVDIHFSCNIHSGVELINYPWDTYSERHADDEWFRSISRDYADTVQYFSPPHYFRDLDNGVTNGFDWYEVNGGRQDYHIYFERGRETTLELSRVKLLAADTLPAYWEYNRNALLNYMEEGLYGVRGIVTDCATQQNLEVEVRIDGHDKRNSSVFSSSESGAYFRYLAPGNYDISYLAEGYDTLILNTTVVDKSTIYQNIELCPTDMVSSNDNFVEPLKITIQGNNILLDGSFDVADSVYQILDMSGRIVSSGSLVDRSIDLGPQLTSGYYSLHIMQKRKKGISQLFFLAQ